MDCRMSRGVYLRANGEINCYCSAGEQITLDRLPLDRNDWHFVRDVYARGSFAHIRDSLGADRLPFPDHCLKCNYLAPQGEFQPELTGKTIEWMHLEASAACNLRCPYCVHGIPAERRVYSRPGPHRLPEDLYRKMIDDIRSEGLAIRWMYFSGRGEPGLHPGLWPMVAYAKERFATNFLVNTNGNIPYSDRIVDSGLDKIKIALDSLDQEKYGRYRVGGSAQRVLDLTRRIVERRERIGSKTPQVIWQKVLHDYNDSPEELRGYQKAALEMGVDSIRLVYTFTAGHTRTSPAELERIFPRIEILDCQERDDISPETLRKRRAEAVLADSPAGHVKVASDILHWFQMGMADRDAYDAFCRTPVADAALYAGRSGHPCLGEYARTLRETLSDLAELHAARGDAAAAEYYRRSMAGPQATKLQGRTECA